MDAKHTQGKEVDLGTFVIYVKYRQHATWQGEVVWTDTRQRKCFRSALELLKLIDEALNHKTEGDTEESQQ